MAISVRPVNRLPCVAGRLVAVLLTAVASSTPAFAQQTASLEYYLTPVSGGVNTMTFAPPELGLTSELGGVILTFKDDLFLGEFVAHSSIDLTMEINAVLPDLSATPPGQPATIYLEGGGYQAVSSLGEIIDGTLSNESTLELEPYAPAPSVMFFKATFFPETTNIQGGPAGVQASLDRIIVWGFLSTNGVDFSAVQAFPSNQQYELTATVN